MPFEWDAKLLWLFIDFLHSFLNVCFDLAFFRCQKYGAIIAPIPKGADKNPYPHSHTEALISLVSCIYKVFTWVLNNRITGFTEDTNVLHRYDEQNGFRKSRSCRDHIFGHTSIVWNSLAKNKRYLYMFYWLTKSLWLGWTKSFNVEAFGQ